jgi:hypothetical protein
MSEPSARLAELPLDSLESRPLALDGALAPAPAVIAPVLPSFDTVVREQLSTVGQSLRREAIALAALLGFVTATIVSMWIRSRGGDVDFHPQALLPVALVGFFAPLAVWKSEGPDRRGYHRAMPVDQAWHALAKVISGWAWYLAAAAVYVGWLLAMAGMTGGSPFGYGGRTVPLWAFLPPIVGGSVLYFGVSAVALVARQPWRWLAGAGVAWVMIRVMGEAMPAMEPLAELAEALWEGPWGALTLVTGQAERWWQHGLDFAAWVQTTVLWGAAALGGLLWAARRQPDA